LKEISNPFEPAAPPGDEAAPIAQLHKKNQTIPKSKSAADIPGRVCPAQMLIFGFRSGTRIRFTLSENSGFNSSGLHCLVLGCFALFGVVFGVEQSWNKGLGRTRNPGNGR
jgi:hypothetical protein